MGSTSKKRTDILKEAYKRRGQGLMKISRGKICGWFGITRQAHHQKKRREETRKEEEAGIMEKILRIRQFHPRIGTRKLLVMMKRDLEGQEIQIGRDRFFEFLRDQDLLVPRKRKGTRTTFPGGIRSENLLASAVIDGPDQAVVVGITYLDTDKGYVYLALVTDLYPRNIMGWDLSGSLSLEGALRAPKRASGTPGVR